MSSDPFSPLFLGKKVLDEMGLFFAFGLDKE